MDEKNQEKAIDAVRDWCKWLLGLNFTSAGGCVVVMERGVSPDIKPWLLGGIVLFALSAVTAALVLGVLASLVQHLPLKTTEGSVRSIFDYGVWRQLSLGTLIKLQISWFAVGIIFVLIWIALKPAGG